MSLLAMEIIGPLESAGRATGAPGDCEWCSKQSRQKGNGDVEGEWCTREKKRRLSREESLKMKSGDGKSRERNEMNWPALRHAESGEIRFVVWRGDKSVSFAKSENTLAVLRVASQSL